MKSVSKVLAAALLSTLSLPAAGQVPNYTARFVGPGTPAAINDLGQVAGNQGGRAWFAGVTGGPVLLPLPAGATGSVARDLNDLGWVVGRVSGAGFFDAVVWKPAGPGSWSVTVIETPTGTDADATAVNDRCDVIGWFVGGGNFYYNESEGFVEFYSFIPLGQAPWPADINNERLVVGRDFSGAAATVDLDTKVLTQLGLPTGTGTNYMAVDVNGVNDAGDLCGRGVVATGGPNNDQAVRYDAAADTWLALNTPVPQAWGLDLDSAGNTLFIVGFSSPVFVYFPGQGTFNLQTRLVPAAAGWSVGLAVGGDISDDGLIVCTGGNSVTGESGVVVLAPASASGPVAYCTAGISASGCTATLAANGTASASAPSGFVLGAAGVEGGADGLFFFGTSGRQANSWGNGTSFRCVVPPTARAGLLVGVGTNGFCDGAFLQDLNALWAAKPAKNPGAGALVQAQLWYRDPLNTSNQTTSLSDALEFTLLP